MAVRGNNNIIQQQHFRSNYSFYGSPGFSNSPGVSTGTQAFSFNFTPPIKQKRNKIKCGNHIDIIIGIVSFDPNKLEK